MEREFINIEIPNERELLFAELKAQFNPEGSKLRTYQLSLLNILIEFDKYARENNITYSLAYGTALGAIRHKGFIPWDEDLDIMMPRRDYEEFIKKAPEMLGKEFLLDDHSVNCEYFNPFAKLRLKNTAFEIKALRN